MGKIDEIIESKVSFVGTDDYDWIVEAMKEYAEWYANKCLSLVDKMPQEVPIMCFQLPPHD